MALLIGRRIINNRLLHQTQKRHGYIVLVPEIGEDVPGKNPLIQEDGLPQFNNVTIETCMATIGRQTLELEADIRNIEKDLTKKEKVNILQDVIEPMEKLGSNLDLTWGISKTMYLGNSSLMPTKSYLAIHERARSARSMKFSSLPIYKAALESLNNTETKKLTTEDERVVRKYVLEGKLNGLLLDDNHRTEFSNVLKKMLEERRKFKSRVDVATQKFSHKINDEMIIRSFPQEVKNIMSESPNEGPWTVTLQPHIYSAFMEHCPDRELRWNVWQAYVGRGSGYGDRQQETSTVIEEIRFLRRDQARLLGYKTFAQMSMETKMAANVENVHSTIENLMTYAKPAQTAELESLNKFAKEAQFPYEKIELWDYDYWNRKQCKSLYDYNETLLQEYFQLQKVLDALFDLCENLFDVKIKQRNNVPTWHKDVRYYDVFESHSSAPIAGFYFDPYARSNDKSHMRQASGWMVGIQNKSRIADTKPLAALIFNFQTPTDNKPSLLTVSDLKVLFFRFGQTLQHILSRSTYAEVAGLSNIEWDAVEVSGHVMQMWLHNKSIVMDRLSCHYLSEDKLPSHMFDSMEKTSRHGAGTALCRELYLAALDLELHSVKDYWLDVVKNVWPQFINFPLEKVDSHVCNFTPIFCEEWGAAYFSHFWSRMVAADVYSAFHEVQGDERQTRDVGKRFRDTFLALGGGCHPNQTFRNFRGRDPSPRALIASLALKRKDESV